MMLICALDLCCSTGLLVFHLYSLASIFSRQIKAKNLMGLEHCAIQAWTVDWFLLIFSSCAEVLIPQLQNLEMVKANICMNLYAKTRDIYIYIYFIVKVMTVLIHLGYYNKNSILQSRETYSSPFQRLGSPRSKGWHFVSGVSRLLGSWRSVWCVLTCPKEYT